MTSLAEARASGAKKYFTGKPCKSGHVSERWVNRSVCVECSRQSVARNYQRNADARKKKVLQWGCANQGKVLANKAAYRERNRDLLREKHREYHASKPEIATKNSAARRARRRFAQPPWVAPADLLAVYRQAQVLSALTGIKYSVDHVIPLKHPLVCGLHVPWNLEAVPLLDNKRKSNRFEVTP